MVRGVFLLSLAAMIGAGLIAACGPVSGPPASTDRAGAVVSGADCAAAFCDDFEDDQAGAPPGDGWLVEQKGAPRIEVDDSRAFSGEKSVRITAAGRETAFIARAGGPLFPLAGNVLYGRAMMFLDAAPEDKVHWTLIEGSGIAKDGSHRIKYRYGGQFPITDEAGFRGNRLMANYETNALPGSGVEAKSDCWHHARDQTVMPTGRWVCLAFELDGRSDGMKLWQDGALLDDLTVDGAGQGCVHQDKTYRWQAPVFDRIDLGWESYQEDETRSLWIDDVALGDRPLSCLAG
jgi:hypothetical protein